MWRRWCYGTTNATSISSSRATVALAAEPDQRVVLPPCHPLLQRDQRVIGDLDVLGADLSAALGDVAVAEAEGLLSLLDPVGGVGRVHLQLGHTHQVPRPGERVLVLGVVSDDVAGV